MTVTRRAPARPLILALIAAMALAILPAATAKPVLAVSPDVVISEVYGGGGNAGATLTNDFIELFNRGSCRRFTQWMVRPVRLDDRDDVVADEPLERHARAGPVLPDPGGGGCWAGRHHCRRRMRPA